MTVIAEVGSGLYNLLLFLHILAAMVAMAPGFVHPFYFAWLGKDDPSSVPVLARLATRAGMAIYLPALVVNGVLGILLILTSGDVISFADTWISLSFLVWFAMLGILFFVLMPAERAVSEGDMSGEAKTRQFGGILHLLLAVILYLMVFKPGA